MFTNYHSQMVVLIDDDEVVCELYAASAKRRGIELLCFGSVAEFLEASPRVPRSTLFLIDQQLRGNKKGHQQARELHRRSFDNLVVVTAYPEGVPTVTWIKEVRRKIPPIWEQD